MLLDFKTIPLQQIANTDCIVNFPEYSEIIYITIYKGGYDEFYCRAYYKLPDRNVPDNKKVHLMIVNENQLKHVLIDDRYRFLKSIGIERNGNHNIYRF